MRWRLLIISFCLLFLLPACQQTPSDGKLTIVFPTETTERAGGRLLRVTASLADNDGLPVEKATVQVELRAPSGDVFATLPGADTGQGRYQADYVRLPWRGTSGTWRVVARATWGNGKQTQGEGTFKGLPSYSEELQGKCGFWIEPPRAPELDYKWLDSRIYHREDGSGYLFIFNRSRSRIHLDVHWQRADFPADEAAASAYAREMIVSFQGDWERIPSPNLMVERSTFQGQPAWHVVGQWGSSYGVAKGTFNGPMEWTIFRCPDSEWLWTLIIYTANEPALSMDNLRTAQQTFECPASK